jgi:hypothetical protein
MSSTNRLALPRVIGLGVGISAYFPQITIKSTGIT